MRPTTPAAGFVLLLLASFACGAAAQVGPTVFAGFEHTATGTATLSVPVDFSWMSIGDISADGGGATWQLDAEGGTIQFGDGIRGARPSSGGWNVEGQYRYGGGATGSIGGAATLSDPTLSFDFTKLTTATVYGALSASGNLVEDGQFGPLTMLPVEEWPSGVRLIVDQGELRLDAFWDHPISMQLPDQQVIQCDEATFRSQTGGVLAGEEIGPVTFDGYDLEAVQILGERFREDGFWYEVSGNFRLNRQSQGHELTHVYQQGAAGEIAFQPPEPCRGRVQQVEANAIAIEELVLQTEGLEGTRMEHLDYARLPDGTIARIPAHSVEWTDVGTSDPGMSLLGGFVDLGALSWTVQIFHDGLLVDTESGLTGEVARAKEYIVQYSQTNLDFLNQRAASQIDLGADTEITIFGQVPRVVTGDRVHIIPEQLQIFPDCLVATAASATKFERLTLKRGIYSVPLAPASALGLVHRASGDAILALQNGVLSIADDAWGPAAGGPLSGGARTRIAGLDGFRFDLAGNISPLELPPSSLRSFRVTLDDGTSSAGLDVGVQNGQFAIVADFAALGSTDADVEVWNGSQRVWSGILPAQAQILAAADFDRVEMTEDGDGLVEFALEWNAPVALVVDGQQTTGTRVSERLRHRDRLVSLVDFESLITDSPGVEVHRASVRRSGYWLTAVGDVQFLDPGADPLVLSHRDPVASTGVEVEAKEDLQGAYNFMLEIAGPGDANVFDGDELVTLVVQDDQSTVPARKAVFPPGTVVFQPVGAQWNVFVDFAAAGYSGFKVMADGAGELFGSTSPGGLAATCDVWPTTQIVKGVGDELWIRLLFPSPTVVDSPGLGPVTTDALTLRMTGVVRPPFPGGFGRWLFQGIETTVINRSPVVVAAPPSSVPGVQRSVVLHPARPNPFNPRTEIRFELASPSLARLAVFDVSGRRVRTLLRGPLPAGPGKVVWDGQDDAGRAVSSGLYLVRLWAPGGEATAKVMLLR